MARANRRILALSAAAGLAALLVAEAAVAFPKAVTAQSRYGNGSVTGAVRINPRGFPEVRLPSGYWADCEGDCSRTLRRLHLDFWETIEEESGGSRPR